MPEECGVDVRASHPETTCTQPQDLPSKLIEAMERHLTSICRCLELRRATWTPNSSYAERSIHEGSSIYAERSIHEGSSIHAERRIHEGTSIQGIFPRNQEQLEATQSSLTCQQISERGSRANQQSVERVEFSSLIYVIVPVSS